MNYDNEEEYGPGEGEVYQHQATRRLGLITVVIGLNFVGQLDNSNEI